MKHSDNGIILAIIGDKNHQTIKEYLKFLKWFAQKHPDLNRQYWQYITMSEKGEGVHVHKATLSKGYLTGFGKLKPIITRDNKTGVINNRVIKTWELYKLIAKICNTSQSNYLNL